MSSKTTLYELLNDRKVVIPLIQRDYAQGRKDKAFIRKNFLNSIKDCLETGEKITLDFVYGSIENDSFAPLDGQQRLTTLWLIHWYLSFKTNHLKDDINWLNRFSYETRSSSREFCKSICEKMTSCEITDNLSSYIKSQSWFYSSWIQDPTISSMLRTICGESDSVTKDDCIESVFNCSEKLEQYRENLINNEFVTFELMEIGSSQLPISDDLYIKMNARGKQLTDFENFKADFVKWIQSDDLGLKDSEEYTKKLDNAWTDVFWKSAIDDLTEEQFSGNIDGAFFSFINRYAVNELCVRETNLAAAEFAAGKGKEENSDTKHSFNRLIGLKGSSTDDISIQYEDFDAYRKYFDESTIKNLDKVLSSANFWFDTIKNFNFSDTEDDEVTEDKYSFLPKYKFEKSGSDDGKVVLLSTKFKERVYFLAICRYIETNDNFDKSVFNDWMRIVKNITENAMIDSLPAMVTCLRLINDICINMESYSWDVHKCISEYSEHTSDGSQLFAQLREEIEKASKICDDINWKDKIITAENFSFFNGSIRFLYRNAENKVDWDDFDKKYANAKSLFALDNKHVKTSTIEAFLGLFENFSDIYEEYFFTNVGYHRRNQCWKRNILCSDDVSIICKVHSLLLCDTLSSHTAEYRTFLDSGIIAKIVNQPQNYKYRYHWHNDYAIHKQYSQSEGVNVSERHKYKQDKLHNASDVQVQNTYENGYYWGTNITFTHYDKQYCWLVFYENNASGDKCIDKIYYVQDGKRTNVSEVWDNNEDITDVLARLSAKI